jgi:hypothetical protein
MRRFSSTRTLVWRSTAQAADERTEFWSNAQGVRRYCDQHTAHLKFCGAQQRVKLGVRHWHLRACLRRHGRQWGLRCEVHFVALATNRTQPRSCQVRHSAVESSLAELSINAACFQTRPLLLPRGCPRSRSTAELPRPGVFCFRAAYLARKTLIAVSPKLDWR